MADVATLGLKVDASGVVKATDALDRFKRSGADAEREASRLTGAMSKLKIAAGAMAGALAVGALHKMVKETTDAQHALAQLEAGIRSTGGAAGKTSQELQAFAKELQRTSTYGDDAVVQMQALLLTFTRISGPEFDRATQAVADMAARLGTDLKSAALQVGKALNDPILGLTMLGRAGVQFSEAQKELIKQHMEAGRQAEAQRVILAELEVQFGGSAKAARDTLGGAIAGLTNAWGDLFEISGDATQGQVDAINSITRALERLDTFFGDFFRNTQLGWVNIEYAARKFHTVMSFDFTKNWSEQMQQIRKELDRLETERLSEKMRIRTPAPIGVGTPPPVADAEVEAAKKRAMEIAQAQADIAKAMQEEAERALEDQRREIVRMTDDLAARMTDAMTGWLGPFKDALGGAIRSIVSGVLQRRIGGLIGLGGMGDDTSLGGQINREAMTGAIVGGGVGYGIGNSMQSAPGGFVVGGLSGAAAGFMAAGPVGAAVGGLAGALGGLIGGLTGSAEAAKRARQAFEDFNRSVAFYVAESKGDTSGAQIIAEQQRAEALRRQAAEQYESILAARSMGLSGGRIDEGYQEYLRVLGQINEAERARIEAIKKESDAVRDLNGQLINLPAGFKVAGYVFDALAAIPNPNIPASPPPSTTPGSDTPFVVQLNLEGQQVARVVVNTLERKADQLFGDSTRWSEVTT